MPHTDTWLTVILTTYQGERYLAAALESVAREPLDGVEVLAVDDGSTDGTAALLEHFASRLPLRTIRLPHTGNWAANTNVGLREARGTFVSLLHQDDTWLPGRLATLRGLAARHPAAGLLVTPALYLNARGERVGAWTPPLPRRPVPLPPDTVLRRLLVQNPFALPAPLFRRSLATAAGGMDPSLWFLADWKLWAAIAAQTPVVYHPVPLVGYRLHTQAQTVVRSGDADDLRRQYHAVLQAVVENLGGLDRDAARACRAGALNAELSVALAQCAHGVPGAARRLAHLALRGGSLPTWRRLWRDGCLRQRLAARLRARTGRAAGGGAA